MDDLRTGPFYDPNNPPGEYAPAQVGEPVRVLHQNFRYQGTCINVHPNGFACDVRAVVKWQEIDNNGTPMRVPAEVTDFFNLPYSHMQFPNSNLNGMWTRQPAGEIPGPG